MTPVAPQDLAAHWPFVESGLKEIVAITGEDWTPTHVKRAINEEWAWLFVDEDGFVVLQVLKREWTADSYLNVWAMWFKPDKAREKRKELFAFLDERADAVGLPKWEFGSPRMGWKALDGDCEIVKITWRRKR